MPRQLSLSRRRTAGPTAMLLMLGVAGIVRAPAAQTILREWRGTNQPGLYSDEFGWTMAGVGDVDGDGVPDVAVGAPWTNVGTRAYAGRLYVYSGKDGHTIFTLDGSTGSDELGSRVLTGPGDMDRDGHADILVYSNYPQGPTPTPPGGIHLVSGRTGTIRHTYLGSFSVASIGDGINAVPDLLLGKGNSVGPPGAGLVQLISSQTGAVIYSYTGSYAYQFLRVGGRAGDVDGDGVHDLLLGSWGTSVYGTGPNGIWVYSGSTGGLLYRVAPSSSTGSFPAALAGVGDVNGDGFDDVASSNAGVPTQINIFAGPTGVPLTALTNPSPHNRIGDSLSAVGDVDGDGFDDVLTGGMHNGGRAIVFSGQNQSVLAFITGGPLQGPYITAGVGDTNGDDFPDFTYGSFYDYVMQVAVVRLYSGAPTGVSTIGLGCADSRNITPRIGCTYVPAHGQPFAVNLSRVQTGLPAILVLGLSAMVPPLQLSVLGAPGCYLSATGDVLAITSTSGPASKGRASVGLSIPNNPALIGSSFYSQWLVVEPLGSGPFLSMTRTLRVTIQ